MRRTRNTLYLSAARLLGQAVGFFSFPLILGILGKEGWGVCSMLLALSVFVGLLDLGLGEGLCRMLVARVGRGEMEEASSIHRAIERVVLIAGGVQVLAFVVLALMRGESLPLYVLAGLTLVARTALMNLSTWFAAHHDFRDIAIANVINNLLGSVGALGLVLWMRRPEALFIAWLMAGLISTAYIRLRIRKLGLVGAGYTAEHVREASIFSRSYFASKVATAFQQGSDRLAIQHVLGNGALGQYSSGCRLPETANEVLPLYSIAGPEMIQAREKGPEEFAQSVNHNLRMALLVAMVAIAIPCSFGPVFGRVWLGPNFIPEIGWVMALMGSYYAVGVYMSMSAHVILATGKAQQILPFTLFNASVTLFGSPYIAKHYGIVGVAVMNVSINVLLIVPLTWVTLRLAMAPSAARSALSALSGIFLIGCLAVATGMGASNWLAAQGWNWGFLVAAPLLMVVVSAAIVGLGLSPMPHLFSRLKSLVRKV